MSSFPKKKLSFPVYVPKKTIKGRFRLFIGAILLVLNPNLKRRFKEGNHPSGRLERWALSSMIAELEKKHDEDNLAKIHAGLWSNPQYMSYYEEIVDRNKRGFLLMKEHILHSFSDLIGRIGPVTRFVEFGCGNGWLLNELSLHEQLGEINEFIGLDINASQILKNKSTYHQNKKISFVSSDILDFLMNDNYKNTIYFTFGGVLEYLSGQQFEKMIDLIAKKEQVAVMFFEPIQDANSVESATQSLVFGTELSFSHPYFQLINRSKLDIHNFQTFDWIGGDWVFVVASNP